MLNVRDARPEDAAGVAGVHVRAWQAGYRGLLPDQYLDGLRPEDRMARYTFGSGDPSLPSTIVAVEDGAVRGFATSGPSRDADASDGGEVLALYVDPGAWGRGVGRLLIAEARTCLVGRGITEAVLWVLVGNERAQRFYRADGWEPDDTRRRVEVWGIAVDEIRYRRRLP
ncbi:MAG TPA: GNAT family N-acetyltransferase [Acidimicrobiales bacterium]|nr:GNAT family N-acetyltransferase [Acidimicrobiales bacterium]HLN41182.1 GNAT family N-acetyltransferase [Acidimicrobiales bacterium]